MTRNTRIRPRDRDAILQSLAAGVVPRRGLQHIQVGRANEVSALLRDVDRVIDGGSAIRFVIGEYGSGKSFFLHLIRTTALEKQLVTMHADLTPDRRIYATGGQARSLYTELARNLSTRTSPDGGGLPSVVERFIGEAQNEARDARVEVDEVIHERLATLSELVGGYDFATVVAAYWRGHNEGLVDLRSSAVRWLRGEYSTRTDARRDLGVRTIVDDDNVYDRLKLLARFVHLAGYGGLIVALDELVNLYKLANTRARNSNYEQILRIINDCLQGSVAHLGFILAGTPEFLTDTRRGLYSYEALQSRLSENMFASSSVRDFSGPVLRLANLTAEELFVVLTKLRDVHASGEASADALPDQALHSFMEHCSRRVGDAYFRTPRTTIRAFVQLLAILEQNPDSSWPDLVGQIDVERDVGPPIDSVAGSASISASDDELASFRL
ncbi:MAG: ATP-binding protein [Chloroflexota bacterium]|nr:ATP-binding protein [Chloroflexota bacterium]